MNDNSLEDNIVSINKKLDLLSALFKNKDESDNKGFFNKLAATFDSDNKEKERKRRLSQKEKIYQAVPIVIDGITVDGKKQVAKLFKTTVSTPFGDDKKPETSSWLKKLAVVGAILIGVVIGFMLGLIDKLKSIKDLIFKRFKGLGKFFEELFEGIKLKFLRLIENIKTTKFGKYIIELLETKVFKPIMGLFETIGRLFKVFESGKGSLFLSKAFPKLFKTFEFVLRPLMGALKTGIKLGKRLGKFFPEFFIFLESLYGIYQAFTDPRLSDKGLAQKLVTGIVKGVLNTFDIFTIFSDRLNFVKFEEIRDRIEAIFKPFREGKWITGIGQILNQVVSFIVALPGKALGMIVGYFNKDLGDAILRFYERFDMVKWVKYLFKKLGKLGTFLKLLAKAILPIEPIVKLVSWCFKKVKPILKFVGEKILGFFKFLGDVISMLWQKIKEFAKWVFNLPIFGKMAKKLNEITDEVGLDETEMPKQEKELPENAMAGGETQLPTTEETPGSRYNVGSPLDNMVQSGDLPSDSSIKELTAVVKELNDNFKQYTDLNGRVHTNNAKMMGENTELLKDIRDKKAGGSNIMVQNTANNTSIGDGSSTNLNYRRELSERITF